MQASIRANRASKDTQDIKMTDNAAIGADNTDNAATDRDNIDDTATSDNNTDNATTGDGNTDNAVTGKLVQYMYPCLHVMVEKLNILAKLKHLQDIQLQ